MMEDGWYKCLEAGWGHVWIHFKDDEPVQKANCGGDYEESLYYVESTFELAATFSGVWSGKGPEVKKLTNHALAGLATEILSLRNRYGNARKTIEKAVDREPVDLGPLLPYEPETMDSIPVQKAKDILERRVRRTLSAWPIGKELNFKLTATELVAYWKDSPKKEDSKGGLNFF